MLLKTIVGSTSANRRKLLSQASPVGEMQHITHYFLTFLCYMWFLKVLQKSKFYPNFLTLKLFQISLFVLSNTLLKIVSNQTADGRKISMFPVYCLVNFFISCVQQKKLIQVLNNLRVSKWWHNFQESYNISCISFLSYIFSIAIFHCALIQWHFFISL